MKLNEVFSRDFCEFLEYRLCALFQNCSDIEARAFWCDGIIFEKMVSDNTACFTAFAGKSGQEKHSLYLRLGEISLGLYLKGMDLQSCVPDTDQPNAFSVDLSRKSIFLSLR